MLKSLGHLRFVDEHRDPSVEDSWGNRVWQQDLVSCVACAVQQ